MKLLLGAALLLMGCGEPQVSPDYQSPVGTSYRWISAAWTDTSQIDRQEAWLLDNLPEKYDQAKSRLALSRATVEVYGEPIVCEGHPKGCNGLQVSRQLLKVRDMGCVFSSALAHEEAHLIQEVHGVYDPDHLDAALWAVADSAPEGCP